MTVGRNTVAGEQLRGFVERIERIRAEKKQLGQDEAAIVAEAKSSGFNGPAIRQCVKIRAMKPHDRQESEAMLDMYLHALGMASEPPLFRAAGLAAIDTTAREQVIERMKEFVPPEGSGSIVVKMGGEMIELQRGKDGEVTERQVREAPPPGGGSAAASLLPERPRVDVPDVDDDGAEALGVDAFRSNAPITANPFPFGDGRRPRWDKGWRNASGTDGMGPDSE